MITKPVSVSLSVCLHLSILFLASKESAVVLLVADSQGWVPDIPGTLTLLMVLGSSPQYLRL